MRALLVVGVAVLAGCTETPTRSPEQDRVSYACIDACAVANVPLAPKPAPVHLDARDQALVLLAEALAGKTRVDPMAQCVAACGGPAVAFEKTVQTHNKERTKQITAGAGPLRTIATGVGVYLGALGVSEIVQHSTGDSTVNTNTSVANSNGANIAGRGDALDKSTTDVPVVVNKTGSGDETIETPE